MTEKVPSVEFNEEELKRIEKIVADNKDRDNWGEAYAREYARIIILNERVETRETEKRRVHNARPEPVDEKLEREHPDWN